MNTNTPATSPLQKRVMAVLEEKGPIPAKDIGHHLPGVDRGALDCALNTLVMSGQVTLTGSIFSMKGEATGVPGQVSVMPTAAASLVGEIESFVESRQKKAPKAIVVTAPIPSRPPSQGAPPIDVPELIREKRQWLLKSIEIAAVDLENMRGRLRDLDKYLELHERLVKELAA